MLRSTQNFLENSALSLKAPSSTVGSAKRGLGWTRWPRSAVNLQNVPIWPAFEKKSCKVEAEAIKAGGEAAASRDGESAVCTLSSLEEGTARQSPSDCTECTVFMEALCCSRGPKAKGNASSC